MDDSTYWSQYDNLPHRLPTRGEVTMPEEQDLEPLVEKQEHVHIWDILNSQVPKSQPHPRLGATNITLVLVRCKTCNLPQTVELDGLWLLQDILRNNAKIEHRDER